MSEQSESDIQAIRDVNARLRALVERETLTQPFWTGGLIHSLHLSDRGHFYFDLYDNDHSIYCMIREEVRGSLDFTPNTGMEVEVFGVIRVYEKQAKLQIDVQQIRLINRPAFIPDMSIQDQLEKNGLRSRANTPMPKNIKRIALITSRHSNAEHDFNATYRQEGGTAALTTIDVPVQGEHAPRKIADAINRINQNREADLIVLVRGGGRVADLATFDDFLIVEAICRSTIPVVTGIGHQPDTTWADRVADISKITPTAAASYLASLSHPNSPPSNEAPKRHPQPTANSTSSQSQWRIFNAIMLVILVIALVVIVVLLLRTN